MPDCKALGSLHGSPFLWHAHPARLFPAFGWRRKSSRHGRRNRADPRSLPGKPSFVRAMAAQLADKRPFDGFEQWGWEWLRQDLTVAQIEEGLTAAFEYGPNPSHSLVFNILKAARSRVEHGLLRMENSGEEPSATDNRRYIEALRQGVALTTIKSGGRLLGKRNFRPTGRPSSEVGLSQGRCPDSD